MRRRLKRNVLAAVLCHGSLARGTRRRVRDGPPPRPLLPRVLLGADGAPLRVMNLVWVAVIAVAVLVEKAQPRGDLVGRIAGVALIIAGAWLAARAVLAIGA